MLLAIEARGPSLVALEGTMELLVRGGIRCDLQTCFNLSPFTRPTASLGFAAHLFRSPSCYCRVCRGGERHIQWAQSQLRLSDFIAVMRIDSGPSPRGLVAVSVSELRVSVPLFKLLQA